MTRDTDVMDDLSLSLSLSLTLGHEDIRCIYYFTERTLVLFAPGRAIAGAAEDDVEEDDDDDDDEVLLVVFGAL